MSNVRVNAIEVGGDRVPPGERLQIRLSLGQRPDGDTLGLPVVVVNGARPGTRLVERCNLPLQAFDQLPLLLIELGALAGLSQELVYGGPPRRPLPERKDCVIFACSPGSMGRRRF